MTANDCPVCGHKPNRQDARWSTDGSGFPVVIIEDIAVHKCCAHELEYLLDALGNGEIMEADHVLRWVSSGNCLMADAVALLERVACATSEHVAATAIASDADTVVAFARYRKAQAERSPAEVAEAQAEARAAHGPGVTLVDVISGERWTT